MMKLSKWRSQGRQRSMCFAATGRLQGRAAKLLLVRRKSRCNEDFGQICLAANVGGMVSCRVRSDFLSRCNELDKRENLETGTATAINYTTCWVLAILFIKTIIWPFF
jgi:hypothetical protein